MSYTDVFGGELIFPTRVSYLALTIAADVVLQWPTEQQITGDNVVADVIDVNATAASLNIDMPSALNTATGNKTTFNNVGANAVNVRDSTGGTIQVVQPGEQWVLVLTDNTTAAGSWTTFQLGAQVAVASASALAGAGIKAIGVLLNQKIDSDVKASTPVTIVDGDRAKCLIYTAGAGIANLPSAGTVGNDWFFMLRNSGSGTLTITPPAGTIDGSATVNLDPNDSAFIFTDGSNFFTIGLSSGSTIAFDFVSIPVPGSGDFVLSGANLNRIAYRFTGALTGNRRIVVPNTTQQYWVDNQTTGAFTLSVSTVAQVTPPEVAQGNTAILYSDATDVVNATSQTSIVFPVTVAQGGTSATDAATARTNLNAAFDGRVLTAGAGLSGGGDLTSDRTFTLDINSANTTPTPAAGDFVAFEDIDDNLTYKATIQDIVDAATLSPSQLVDGVGNVRAEAQGAGILELRSQANATAERRLLQFARQDGTDTGRVGQTQFDNIFTIENQINDPTADIEINTNNANATVVINSKLQIPDAGITTGVGIRGTSATNARLRFTDTFFADRVQLGFVGDVFDIYNLLDGNGVQLSADDLGSGTKTLLFSGDPDGSANLYHSGNLTVQTVADTSGGLEVNNLSTGAGFERVLTASDGVTSGSFTLTLTGVSGVVTGTVQWTKIGDLVAMTIPAAILGTSNANTLGGTGVPANLRPSTVPAVSYSYCIDNASTTVLAQTDLSTGGVFTFSYPVAGAVDNFSSTGWTASGLKGLLSGWNFVYRIN